MKPFVSKQYSTVLNKDYLPRFTIVDYLDNVLHKELIIILHEYYSCMNVHCQLE